MINKILGKISAHLPWRDIRSDETGEKYLERYHLFHLGPEHNPWLIAYLHRFLDGDGNRTPHDHPWWALAWVLHGGYREVICHKRYDPNRQDSDVLRTAGSLRFFGPGHTHRIASVVMRRECWTLFITGPRMRKWGFWHCEHSFLGAKPMMLVFSEAPDSTPAWWKTAPKKNRGKQ